MKKLQPKEPYPHNIANDDDYEDWSRDTDQQFGKPGDFNWWLLVLFIVACVVLLWALHQVNQ